MSGLERVSVETGVVVDVSGNEVRRGPNVSDEARAVVDIVLWVVLNGLMGFFGSAINVVNIIIFFKQGFTDSVNISLCALAVSDVGCLLPMIWTSLFSNPLFRYSDISFDCTDVIYLTGGLPHSFFARATSFITGFITFERCVCVALPLKVKTIITPKRTLIIIVCIFIQMVVTAVPLYSTVYLAPSFHPKRNHTLIRLSFTSDARMFENMSFSFNISTQLSLFIIVTICTVILVLKLLQKSHWRNKAGSVSNVSDSISTRDKRVMKMVTFISIVFIICYLPGVINLIMMVHLSTQYSTTGVYANLYVVSWAIVNTVEGINSSTTIIIYYKMSSKFRATFKELFFTATKLSVNIKTSISS